MLCTIFLLLGTCTLNEASSASIESTEDEVKQKKSNNKGLPVLNSNTVQYYIIQMQELLIMMYYTLE